MHSMQLIALYIYNSTMELCSLNPQHLHHFLTLSDFYNLSLTLSTDSNLAKREEPMNKTFHSITPTYLLKQHPYSIWLPKDNNNGSKEAPITNLNEFEQHERIYRQKTWYWGGGDRGSCAEERNHKLNLNIQQSNTRNAKTESEYRTLEPPKLHIHLANTTKTQNRQTWT